MAIVGRIVTVLGGLLIIAPLVGIVLAFFDFELPWVVEFAPTFILGGLVVFIVGVALQNFGR